MTPGLLRVGRQQQRAEVELSAELLRRQVGGGEHGGLDGPVEDPHHVVAVLRSGTG